MQSEERIQLLFHIPQSLHKTHKKISLTIYMLLIGLEIEVNEVTSNTISISAIL